MPLNIRFHHLGIAAAALAAAAMVFVLYRIDPNQPGNPLPKCVFLGITGFYCAGCGLTRAAHALVHGDIARAISMNAYGMMALLLVPVLALDYYRPLPAWLSHPLRPVKSPIFWVGGAALFWVARNLPWYPFNLLAPG